MAGIASPTFSGDGRTIAFLRSVEGSQEVWLAAADGSGLRRVGPLLVDGVRAPASATGLAWSPAGGRLAFALITPGVDLWAGGSSVWELTLATGRFERLAEGWPVPSWMGGGLVMASAAPEHRIRLEVGSGPRWIQDEARRLAGGHDVLTGGMVPRAIMPWAPMTAGRTVALLRQGPTAAVELVIRPDVWSKKGQRVVAPPRSYRIREGARVAVTQDGTRVLVDLLGLWEGREQRALGIFDVRLDRWTVLTYAWEPAASPAPLSVGPLGARRATSVAIDLLQYWNRFPGRAAEILAGTRDPSLLPFRAVSFVLDPAERAGGAWTVPAIAYGQGPQGFGYRRLTIRVAARHGRLLATPTAASPVQPVRTITDAVAFVELALGADVPTPASLPAGTTLARRPVDLWPWTGTRSAQVNLEVPGTRGSTGSILIQYGRASFTLGCGGEKGLPTQLAGSAALLARFDHQRQIIWPATPREPEGAFGVYASRLSEDELLAIAESMAMSS
jgi:hypothetical protein